MFLNYVLTITRMRALKEMIIKGGISILYIFPTSALK
ncbi:unnamed protein product, partial [marine sediment metagenome]